MIVKVSSTTTITCPTSVTFTGSALTPCSAVVTGSGGLNQSVPVTYTNNTNAGIATASASYPGSSTYFASSDSETFTIDPASSTTTVTCPAGPYTYSGVAQTPCSVSVTGAGGLNLSPTASYTNNVNAGTASASYTYGGDANHTGSSGSATFTIDKASSTVTVSCPANVTYSGTAHEPCTAEATGVGMSPVDVTSSLVYTANVNAGTASADASWAGDANHTGDSGTATFTIDKAPSTTTVTCPAGPYTYSGTAQEPCSAPVTGVGGLSQSLTVTYTDNTDAGTATAAASYAGDANHLGSSDSETFEIGKATLAVDADDTSKVFAALDPEFTWTYSGFVGGEDSDDAAITGTAECSREAGENVLDGPYAITCAPGDLTSTNYDFVTGEAGTFTIDPASSTTTVTCPAGPYTYSGVAQTPCSVSVTGAGGLNLSPTASYTNNVNAGTASASYTYGGDANHTGSSGSATFTIDKADAVCTITGYDVVYDADPHTATGSCQGVQGETLDGLDLSGSTHTNAGDYLADPWSFDDLTGNYNDQIGTVVDQIDKAHAVCTVTGYDVIYDAEPHTATGSCVGVESEVLAGLDLSDTTHNDAGTYVDDPWSFEDVTGNYNDQLGTVDNQIDKAPSTTTVTCPAGPYTYSGTAQEPCSASVTGVGGLSQSLTVTYTDNTDAGTATAAASYAGDANHLGSSDSETFEIGKADAICTVTGYDVVYDGDPHAAAGSCVGVQDETLAGLDLSGTTHTNAGNYPIDPWSFTDVTGNYNDQLGTVADQIDKAPSTTTVTCPAGPFVYSGGAHEPCSASVTGVGGLSETAAVTYTDNIDAGTATAAASYAGDANHLDSSDSETFTIDPASSTTTVTCPAGPYTYSGVAQTPCSVSVTGAGGLNLSPTASYTNNVNAGTASASYTYGGDANHTGSSGSATFTIDKASSTVTVSCPANVTYSGTAHEPCTAEATGVGMSPVDVTSSLVYTANVNAGTASADASWAGDANHTGDSGTATFTIDKAPSTTTVTCPAGPYTYSGTAQEPCSAPVTGVGGLSQSLTVTYTDNTDAGTATAAASYAGDANHLGSSDSETFEIGKAGPTIVISGYDVTFDGAPHTATGTAKGVLDEDLPGLDLSGTTHTNAGTYSDTWTFTDTTGNYLDASGAVTDKIDKASSTTTVTCPASVVYTGSALTPCSALVTGAGGLNQPLTVTYASNTFVGTANASASYAGDADHQGSSASTTFEVTTAFRIIGFDSPVDMTVLGNPRIWNSVKNGQTVPLKFRVFNLDGSEVTSPTGLSAMARNINCGSGIIEPELIPIVSTAETGLRRTGDRFHFNWAVPKTAGKCYQVLVKTVDGSTTMVGSMSGTPVQEAYFKSK